MPGPKRERRTTKAGGKPTSLDAIAQKFAAPTMPGTASAAPAAPPEKRPAREKKSPAKPPPKTRPPLGHAEGKLKAAGDDADRPEAHITVRRMTKRDLGRVWEFLKLSFRDVNRETVEYQRPRSKSRFEESWDDEGIEQLLFEVDGEIVGYAECAFEVTGSDNWVNPRYFESRDMRPLFVEELATHPAYQGRGVGSFMLEQLQHLARIHGCTHLVLEVAENNEDALTFYRRRNFVKLDAALFMAMAVEREPDLLPPRAIKGGAKPKKRKPRRKPTAPPPPDSTEPETAGS
jgi:ribosomal protein S18 acetylase RimI-like enzyme